MVVECIKSVRVFGKTIIAKGRIVDTEDFIDNGLDSSPLRINFCDDEYFKPYEPKYKDGDAVCYINLDKKRYGLIDGDVKENKCRVILEDNSVVVVDEKHLVQSKLYYFINTEGTVHSTFQGKNWQRDKYCEITGNMYDSKAAADKALLEIENK